MPDASASNDDARPHPVSTEVASQADLFRLLADSVPALIAYYDVAERRCRFANEAYARMFRRDRASILGLTLREVIGEEAERQIDPQVRAVEQEARPILYERTVQGPQGRTQWLEVNLLPHVHANGHAIGAFVLISDITRHREFERELRESEERLAKFMEASAEGIVFHHDGVILDANPPMCRLVGRSLEELVGRRLTELVAPDQVGHVAAAVASGQETSYESALSDREGRRIDVELIARTMVRHGKPSWMTIVRDIRDRLAAQARIHHMAHHDALTGLPNRMAFVQGLDESMQTARRQGGRLAMLFIDLDHFKRVNDSLGHMAGDSLLRTIASRIVGALRGTDLVGRFGGDEFMVLVRELPADPEQRAHVEQVAKKLIDVVGAAVHVEDRPLSVTPSIGIALYPGDGEKPEELIEHADAAMYRAKVRGRAGYQFFDPHMASSAYEALVMEGELAQAVQREEFELYFQPQVRAADGAVIGAEALIRWNHPTRGLLSPGEFVGVAEQGRLMLPIGQWVLQQAARCASRWRDRELGIEVVAVNLTTLQFHAGGFVEEVAQVLPDAVLGTGLLELELTERMLMDDLPEVKRRLSRLKALGLRISVDDFGTGYSSLGHLKELPIDKVKIDRSFVQDLPQDRSSAAITKAIVQMGHSLGLKVVAEGVGNESQWRYLAAIGCDQLQGDGVAPAMSSTEFEAWVVARRAEQGAPRPPATR